MSRLSVSMIVKDEQAFLPGCLASVKGIASEIVIADTGSTDNSIAIARNFGARVIEIPWNNDFAEARNRALAEATGDWILSLDADEQLDATAATAIPALLQNAKFSGYQVVIRNYVKSANERIWDQPPKANDSLLPVAAPYPAFMEHENVRVFRRVPEIYFVGRVHESVGPRLRELQVGLGRANFAIHHFGFVVDEETKARKNLAYREMGRRKIQEFPKDWQAYFELGLLELEQYKNYYEARTLFARACDLNSSAGVAWFFMGLTIFRLGDFAGALKYLPEAERAGHRTAMVAETRGDAHYNLGEFEDARTSYEGALKRGHGGPGVMAKLCLATVREGKVEKGLQRLQAALSGNPQVAELHEGLILILVFLNRIEEAARASEEKLNLISGLLPGDYLRCASLWAQLQEWRKSARAIERGLLAYPGNPQLTRVLDEVYQAGPASQS